MVLSDVLRTSDKTMMTLSKALVLSLAQVAEPIITPYRLGLVLHQLYLHKEYNGERLGQVQKEFADHAVFQQRRQELEENGVLIPCKGIHGPVYTLPGRKDAEAEEMACAIDPFCYLSHFSAMAYHGLTDRLPVRLFVASPKPDDWKAFAEERMRRDLGETMQDYLLHGLPPLTRHAFDQIGRQEVHRFNASHLGAFKHVPGKVTRVATLSRTFLDMLRNPELCGGMRHVVEVYALHGEEYLPLIVGEIDRHGGPIDKVRAGYLLEEKQGLHDPAFKRWEACAQRGGSRKLDPAGEYLPKWSDKWCLSLNL